MFALPTVLTSTWRPGVEREAQERGAPAGRLARHLFTTATTAPPGKEVRVTGIGERLVAERRDAWERWYATGRARRGGARPCGTRWRGRCSAARTSARSCSSSYGLRATAGDVLLVLAAGARLSAYIGATVGEIGFLRGIWMDGSRRLAWLEDYAASLVAAADLAAPVAARARASASSTSRSPIPAPTRLVLDDVSPRPAGRRGGGDRRRERRGQDDAREAAGEVVRADRRGAILVDGTPLWRACRPTSGASGWPARSRTSSASSSAPRHTVGVGDVPRLDDEPAVVAAVARAGADDVVGRLAAGLETQLGPTWPGGVELSFGQWQKLALARGFMRDEPLLLVLDEPTAALDAETEHALFERYAAAAARRDARRPHHHPRLAPLLAPCAWPT